MTKLKLGELCAGYGGLGLAVEEAFGTELAWYSEFDAAPSKIMATRWPDVPNHGDMTQIDWAEIEPVDIISGGTPCQDLSAAGRRKGMAEGTRSNLWVNMREAIATIKPTYVAWENVRGAYSATATSDLEFCPGCMGASEGSRGHVLRALGRVLGDLSDLGYDTQWRGLRAADVGAPHGRFRVFVLATRRESVLDAGHGAGRPEFGEQFQDDNGSRESGSGNQEPSDPNDAGLEGQCDSDGATPTERHRHLGPGADRATSNANDREPNIEEGADGAGHCGAEQGRAELWAGGRTSPTRGGADWGIYAPAIRRWEAVRGTAPAPTELTTKGKHRLSARFAEWMMGIPAGWVTDVEISRNEQLKAIGNGVVPQQALAAFKDMLGANHAS